MNRWNALAALLILAIALALRVPHLDTRPLHNDEAVNAFTASALWEKGRYAYDPNEYHGPTLHYFTVPFLALSGAKNSDEIKDVALRIAPVFFGVGLILLLLLFKDALPRAALLWAALFTAISPAMVFYSRYFIHEMLLVFFTALTLGAGWRYTQKPSTGWAALTGAGIGLMFATKETFVIAVAAMVGGLAASLFWFKKVPKYNRNHVLIGVVSAAMLWLLFFSSFFTNFAGLLDSIRTYLPWLKRAGGHSPHIHPWYFYFQRLAWFHPVKGPVWSEGLILVLAVTGTIVSFKRRNPFPCFIGFYTILLAAAYTVISYKTPWCLLGFLHGMILLAGVGAAAILDFLRPKALKFVGAAILLALAAQLSWQAWRASNVYASDRRNPYVYAQTVPDILNLVQKVDGISNVATSGRETVVKVMAPDGDYWPLPWYLRRLTNIGWYENVPGDSLAPMVIASTKLEARLDEKSGRKWIMAGLFELRPQIFFELYVELELWKKYVATLPRETE